MTSEALSLPEGGTAADAVDALRNLDEDFETVHYVYLKDEEGRLSGIVTLNSLLLAEPTARLASIAIDEEIITAGPDDDQEDVAKDIAKYNLLAMPVVDDNRRLLGIVTVDDAIRRECGGNQAAYVRLRTLMANAVVAGMLPDGVVKGGSAIKMRYGNAYEYHSERV